MLTLAAGDKEEKVQRRATAALGELLFYIASRGPEAAAASHVPSDSGGSSPWQVPPSAVTMLRHLLKPGEDEITQVCAPACL